MSKIALKKLIYLPINIQMIGAKGQVKCPKRIIRIKTLKG